MQDKEQCIIILAQDGSPTDAEIQSKVRDRFGFGEDAQGVCIARYTNRNRMQALNACLDMHLDSAERFMVLDASLLSHACTDDLRLALASKADVCCCGDLPLRNRYKNGMNRFLCKESTFWLFSENAVRRMRTADTGKLVEETLADETITLQTVPVGSGFNKKRSNVRQWLLYALCCVDIRCILRACAALSLLGSIVFAVLLLHGLLNPQSWNTAYVIGCLICVHLFVLCLAGLLILWYRRSVKLEKSARDHAYLEESRVQ